MNDLKSKDKKFRKINFRKSKAIILTRKSNMRKSLMKRLHSKLLC